jgi:hypothetical protein
VTFTARVTVDGGFGFRAAPRGTASGEGSVTFSDGGTVLAVVPLDAGQAVFTTALLAAGTHTITATFSGTATQAASSATVQQVVEPAALPATR